MQRFRSDLEKAIADEVALVGRVRSAKKALREHRNAR